MGNTEEVKGLLTSGVDVNEQNNVRIYHCTSTAQLLQYVIN